MKPEPAVLCEEDLLPYFRKMCGVSGSGLCELLEKTHDYDAIDVALEEALRHNKTRFVDLKAMQAISLRLRDLEFKKPAIILETRVKVFVTGVSIPDNAKDEITFHLRIYAGVQVDDLLRFMCENKIILPEEIEDLKRRWEDTVTFIGAHSEMFEKLESCLRVDVKDSTCHELIYCSYNYGIHSKMLWRESEDIITIQLPFNLNAFPFDTHAINLYLVDHSRYDVCDRILLPDTATDVSLEASQIESSREYYYDWPAKSLAPLALAPSQDVWAICLLQLPLRLRRKTSAFVWRVFFPSYMVALLVTIGSGIAIFTGRFVESTMTQVIPGALIAGAALHLSAAQFVPPQSERTMQDVLFSTYYFLFLLLFIALSMSGSIAASVMVGFVAAVLLGILIWITHKVKSSSARKI